MEKLEQIAKTTERLIYEIEAHEGNYGFYDVYKLFRDNCVKNGIDKSFFFDYDSRVEKIIGGYSNDKKKS